MEPVPEDSNLPTSSKNGDTGGLSRPASAKKKTHSTGMSMYLNVGDKGIVHVRLDKTMKVEDAIEHIIKVLGYDPWNGISEAQRALNYIGITMRQGKTLEEYGLIAGTEDTLSYLNQVSGRLGPMAVRTKTSDAKSRRTFVCKEIREVMGLQSMVDN